MLIQITDYYDTVMYLNRDHIGRVDEVKSGAVIYMNLPKPFDGIVVTTAEWERIKPLIALPQSQLEERYTQALHTIYRQSQSIKDLEMALNPEQSPNDFSEPGYDGLPF